ncbi:MAG: cob(I)yrinic acid a,c-diamide adenosyltransferase [Lachnospiraceae bacterium]|nr:cob(I)yrinic acid a,c-diamide adenosyltransferase [Lachnospiraceae bacterium]
MEESKVQIYSGDGHGKSSAALGKAIQAASAGKKVVFIQFLKGLEQNDFIKRLEPEIQLFRFEKSEADFINLPPEQQQEEIQNIKNGLNFARKVLSTGQCDLLILDEVLGLVDNSIIEVEELKKIVDSKPENVDIIFTGIQLRDEVCALADEVSKIETVQFKVWD